MRSVLSGVDVDGGEEVLLGGWRVASGVLLLGPSLEGGGVVLAGAVVQLGLVVGAVPGVGPGRAPPGVEGVEGLGGARGEAALSGGAALLCQPFAQREVVMVGVFAAGEVAVGSA